MHFGLLCLIRTLPNALLWHCAYWTLIKACAHNLHLITMHEFCACVHFPLPPPTPPPSTPRKCEIFIHSFIHSFIYAFIYPVWQKSLTSLNTKYSTLKHELGISHSRFSCLTCGVSIQTSDVSASAAIQHLSFISARWKIYVQLANPWLWNINSRWDAHEPMSETEHIWVI